MPGHIWGKLYNKTQREEFKRNLRGKIGPYKI